MKVAVVGGGAIGMLFSASLAKIEGLHIHLITRTKRQAEIVKRQGISFTSHDGQAVSVPLHAASWPSADAEWDCILLTVKQMHLTESFIKQLAQSVTAQTVIVCFQNGLGHMEQLQNYIPREQLFYAITTEAALRTGLNSLSHTGRGETMIEDDPAGRMGAVVERLKKAGFSAQLSKNIESVIWNKLLINACINPLTALFRVRNGELAKRQEWRELMFTLLEEGLLVAGRLKIETGQHLDEQLISICEQTAMNESSMLQDFAAGRLTEIDYINGSIVRLAEQQGIHVPVQRTVWQMMKGFEARI